LNDYSFLSSSSLLYNINGQSILLVEGTPSKYETYRFTEGMQGACLPLFLHSAHVEAAQERGLKANLKTEAMIELLLDSSPPHSPRRPSRHRTVSTRAAVRQSSTRSRLHSTSSMIVHSDTDEDEMQHTVKPESEAPSTLHPGPVTRTRKALDAQLRLGVGRPTIVGGQGARTVTRSVGIAKSVRSRSGRGAKPTQEPIVEGLSSHVSSFRDIA
jgi:hypothetical protein